MAARRRLTRPSVVVGVVMLVLLIAIVAIQELQRKSPGTQAEMEAEMSQPFVAYKVWNDIPMAVPVHTPAAIAR